MEKRISALKFLTACSLAVIAVSAATVALATAGFGAEKSLESPGSEVLEIVQVEEVITQYDDSSAPSMREQAAAPAEQTTLDTVTADDTQNGDSSLYAAAGVETTQADNPSKDYRTMAVPELLAAPDGTDEYYRDLWMLACVIYKEAGGDACTDTTRLGVGTVVVNRVSHESFPDTIEEVLLQPGQYNTFSWDGIVWPYRADSEVEHHAVYRAFSCAERILNGERAFDESVIWQSGVPQGAETVLYQDGIYFCR